MRLPKVLDVRSKGQALGGEPQDRLPQCWAGEAELAVGRAVVDADDGREGEPDEDAALQRVDPRSPRESRSESADESWRQAVGP